MDARVKPLQQIQNMLKRLFLQNARMESQTAFSENGRIEVYPCSFELEKFQLTNGEEVSFRAKVKVLKNGTTVLDPCPTRISGHRTEALYTTEHCRVNRLKSGRIEEKWIFPTGVSLGDMQDIRDKEGRAIEAFYHSRKEGMSWAH